MVLLIIVTNIPGFISLPAYIVTDFLNRYGFVWVNFVIGVIVVTFAVGIVSTVGVADLRFPVVVLVIFLIIGAAPPVFTDGLDPDILWYLV